MIHPKTQPRASDDGNAPFMLLTVAALFLCLISVPLACSLGPLELSFNNTLAVLASPFFDSQPDSGGLPQILAPDSLRLVVLELRLPRVLLALCAGAGLAVSGAVFQGILRNPLADPFTLGVSGGAAFGAALAISFGFSGAFLGFGIPLFAFAGASLALGAVLTLGRIGGGLRHETLILAGVVVSALLAALIALVKALDESSVTGIVFWIMGSFQGRGWAELLLLLPGLACGSLLMLALHSRLDMLSLGDRTARHLGLDAARVRLVLLLAAGAVTASCVAVSGIIGFIGLIVPHLCRMLLGAAHGRLLPVSALCGALLLLWSDVAARTLLPGGVELPVGVVTALLGGPFFCYILGRKQGLAVARPDNAGACAPAYALKSDLPAGDNTAASPAETPPLPVQTFPISHNSGDLPLVCENISFSYGRHSAPLILDGISFSLGKGEFVGLLGPNGSGKSTLLHCLSGVLRPLKGEVRLQGQDIAILGEKRRARLLAHLPQKPESVPALTALRMVLMGRYAYTPFLGGYGVADKEIALNALAQTGALHLARRSADGLSGGELQRVLLARAIAQQTPVLLLDEATSGLDPACQIAVLSALARKNNSQGLSILAAMHDLNLAALYCGRLILLKEGRILADGPLCEVFTPEILGKVYDCEVAVVPHPATGQPQALLLPDTAKSC